MSRATPFTRVISVLLGLTTAARAYDVFDSQYLYDLGYYGFWPQTHFKSFGLTAPRLNYLTWDKRCDDGYYLIAPKGKIVSKPGPMIIDARGELVWADDKFGIVTDLEVQTYNGSDYLTFWSGPDGTTHGYGRGIHYMLDSNYEVFRKIEPVGEDLKGDLHEFKITEHGTAMMTIYSPVPADLSSIGGPVQGWALDSKFQEVDIETGELLFEWSALEHLQVNETIRYFAGEDDGTAPGTAFDFFHINSMDKYADGNYIVSGRHTSTIHCVSPDGTVLWTLGGKKNSFQDLSDGLATDFTYQHHVRLHDNHTLSIFDNAKAERWGPATPHDYSRALLIQLNTTQMTATLLHEYWDPEQPKHPDSQGSAQVLDDRVVISYGFLPAVTEFARDGSVLCDVQLAPALVSRWGLVTTYRAFKTRGWVGRPTSAPAVFMKPSEGRVYASWNGATEVHRWVLQGAEWADLETEKFVELQVHRKDTFEASFDIDSSMPKYLRVAAVGRDGKVLRYTAIVNRFVGNAPGHFVRNIIVAVVVSVALVLAFLALLRKKSVAGMRLGAVHAIDAVARLVPSSTRWEGKSPLLAYPGADADAYKPMQRWKEWRSARGHELEPLYED
ncbi:Uu.00g107770.m01.CDS01 [Anthostomella pinea]|uniref:Uu.00g107770.m01.CDS01 n=1 Tax=Anthostomella pinea TaxID=933095 RepID=A0AAI8VFD1_9PEZI|nr:Uu.00g107770.m01.CDS01 [Anthostomella pinea]